MKIKEQFKGQIITLVIDGIGAMTFDTNKVKKSEYRTYSKLGFQDYFEVEPVIEKKVINYDGRTKK